MRTLAQSTFLQYTYILYTKYTETTPCAHLSTSLPAQTMVYMMDLYICLLNEIAGTNHIWRTEIFTHMHKQYIFTLNMTQNIYTILINIYTTHVPNKYQ